MSERSMFECIKEPIRKLLKLHCASLRFTNGIDATFSTSADRSEINMLGRNACFAFYFFKIEIMHNARRKSLAHFFRRWTHAQF